MCPCIVQQRECVLRGRCAPCTRAGNAQQAEHLRDELAVCRREALDWRARCSSQGGAASGSGGGSFGGSAAGADAGRARRSTSSCGGAQATEEGGAAARMQAELDRLRGELERRDEILLKCRDAIVNLEAQLIGALAGHAHGGNR